MVLASTARVVFTGLARDCGHSLPAILESISQLAAQLQDWGYVFLENDSVDQTPRILDAFHHEHQRGIVCSIEGLDKKFGMRTQRLAWLRNRCLEEIYRSERLADFEYLIVLDLDAVNECFDSERLLALLDTQEPDWTGIFANQSERYYDIWALRHPTWSPDDCWKQIRQRPSGMSREEAISTFLDKRRIKLDSSGFVQVDSAFGGLGLYRLQALRGCGYDGLGPDGHEVCEHVALHKDLTDKGSNLYIDSELINGRGNQRHSSGMSWMTKAKRKRKKWMTQLRSS